MRVSQFPFQTLKETPSDAEVVSHQLMMRSGMLRKLASGLYTWSPLGLKILRKVEGVVREEMNNSGALELLMPAVQPAELWEESGRWEQYGPELLRLKDRHDREFCFGPTHEEVITDYARREINSYKQLPICYYQIQTKFRDEIRPRFGVMRAREFLMKDAYSFHLDQTSLQATYDVMYDTYSRIFTRLGLDFRAVEADTGSIGGSASHEFHVLAESGEDAIAFSDGSNYAANVELAPAPAFNANNRPAASKAIEKVSTPDKKTIEEVSQFLNIDPATTVKTLLVKGSEAEVVALVVRGDHTLNDIKAEKLPEIDETFELVEPDVVKRIAGCEPGSVGPVGLDIPLIVDNAAAELADFVCGANEDDSHLTGVNWDKDVTPTRIADLREVVAGDPSPCGKGNINIVRGIEVGHIFQLGQKYSTAMDMKVLTESGKSEIVTMGCYGIGVSRVVASAIEQNHDDRGIIWPASIAPFQIALCPMNLHKSDKVKEATEALYLELKQAGYDVIFDDRKVRPGFMFADMELIGIPHRLVIGEKGIDGGFVEYKGRKDSESTNVNRDELLEFIQQKLA